MHQKRIALSAIATVVAIALVAIFANHTLGAAFAPTTTNGYGPGNGMMGGNGYGPGNGMMGGYWTAPQGTPTAGVSQVNMTNQDAFSPAIIQVRVGTTVTWMNKDSDVHTVTFMAMMVNSGSVAANDTFSYTFTQPGTYQYLCMYHRGMTGEVIVTA